LEPLQFDVDHFPFLHYAAEFWPDHTIELEEFQMQQLGLLQRLFHPESTLDNSAERDSEVSCYELSCFGNSDSNPSYSNVSTIRYSFINWLRVYNPDRPFNRQINVFPGPLYYSSLLGLVTLTAWLLQNGAEINIESFKGRFRTALLAASSRGHVSVVTMLLEQGAQINASITNPLQVASYYGHLPAVRLLLEKGPTILHDKKGSALIAAASQSHLEVVQYLLEMGAEVEPEMDAEVEEKTGSKVGRESDEHAFTSGLPLQVLQLLESGDLIYRQDELGSALQHAAYRGNWAMVQLLLDKGADVNAKARRWGTALHFAIQGHGDLSIVQLLLQRGVDVNAKEFGVFGTALQAAVWNKNSDIVAGERSPSQRGRPLWEC